ncbi:MAG: HEAT repeat domain-containing protein [Candidatus Wallbacteria bacterium]|nr:HEAT repeat domain-containing protein [Candidatus Wallbacteria bacterium]
MIKDTDDHLKQFHELLWKFNHGKSEEEKRDAAKMLGGSGNQDAVEFFWNSLEEESTLTTKKEILQSLVKLKARDFEKRLSTIYLATKDPALKEALLAAMVELRDYSNLRILLSNLASEENPNCQLQILNSFRDVLTAIHSGSGLEAENSSIREGLAEELLLLSRQSYAFLNHSVMKAFLELIYLVDSLRFIPELMTFFQRSTDDEIAIFAGSLIAKANNSYFEERLFLEFRKPDLPKSRRETLFQLLDFVKVSPANLPFLSEVLDSGEEFPCLKVLEAIEQQEIRDFQDKIFALFQSSKSRDVKLKCMTVLGKFLSGGDDMTFLLEKLRKEPPEMRAAVYIALADNIPESLIEYIELGLEGESTDIFQLLALKVFSKFRYKSPYISSRTAEFLKSGSEEIRTLIAGYICDCEGRFDHLTGLLSDPSGQVRKEAVFLARKYKRLEILDALYQSFKSESNEKIRAMTVGTFGEFGDAKVVPWLTQALSDKDPRVRANSIESLEKFQLKDPDLEMIFKCLDDENNRVKANAAMALWKFGGLRMITYMGGILKESSEKWQRASAAYALGEIKSMQGLDYLRMALSDREFEVRRNAVVALGKIGDSEAVDRLRDIFSAEYPDVKKSIIAALGQIGSRKAFEALSSIASDDEAFALPAFEQMGRFQRYITSETLLGFLKHPNEKIVLATIDLLAGLGTSEAEQLLFDFRETAGHEMKLRAQKAIEAMKKEQRFIRV